MDAFLDALPADARILDLMCGNGRHLRGVGLDWSEPLLRAARGRGPVVRGDATRLPFRNGIFDACVYVAGLHGLPKPSQRAASLRELRRVLAPDGVAQVTVWSRDAPRFAGGAADVVVPWRRDGHDVERTYHLYTAESLHTACIAAGFDASIEPVQIAAAAPDNLVATLRPRD